MTVTPSPVLIQSGEACRSQDARSSYGAGLGYAIAAGLLKAALRELFQEWLKAVRPSFPNGADEVAWLISKRATALINAWLSNRGMAVLHETATRAGALLISRGRIEHVRDERKKKDGVDESGVDELLTALLINGTPKYAPHIDALKYPNQLLMLDPAYRASTASASGESPVAALQWCGQPVPHLRLETAYWASPRKTKALDQRALKK